MNRQDRQGVRTAPDLEQKYNFKKNFSDVMETARAAGSKAVSAQQSADAAQRAAAEAKSEILKLSDSITLTVTNGLPGNTAQIVLKVGEEEYTGEINLTGLVTIEDLATEGKTVINGRNIKTGSILADTVRSGLLKSINGAMTINMDTGKLVSKDPASGYYLEVDEAGMVIGEEGYEPLLRVLNYGFAGGLAFYDPTTGEMVLHILGGLDTAEIEGNNLTIKAAKVTIPSPTEATDAVNKEYVDGNYAPDGLVSNEYYVTSLSAFESRIEEVYNSMKNCTEKFIQMDLTSGTAVVHSGSWFITIAKRNANIGYLIMTSPEGAMRTMHRWRYAGSWGEWEWVNPPMVPGVEYRTTERWAGLPVYVQNFDVGTMPNNDTRVIPTDTYNVDTVIAWGGTQSDGLVIPHWFGQLNTGVDGVVYYNAPENNRLYIRYTTTGDFSANTAEIWAKYTKTTD